MQSYFRRDICRLCKSRNLEFVCDMPATPLGDDYISSDRLDKVQEEYPLELNYCRECGLVQLANVVNPEAIYKAYLYETSTSLGLKAHFQDYADDIMHRINPPQGVFVVDIGSNDGTLLGFLKGYGMRVLGVEPALHIAKKVTASGIETIPRFFTADLARDIRSKRGPAAVVTANNIFANVDDIDNFIRGVKELLAPDGVFIFETGYIVDLIQNVVADNINHDHLCYFSIKPLVKFFQNNGLEMINVDRIATKGGSIRCTAQRAGGDRPVLRSVVELMTLETELGFDSMTPFKVFTDRLEWVKKRLNEELLEIQSRGKTVTAYGASIGGTTLLYYFNLKNFLSYIIDDNPIKQGLYSPGLHIPVLLSEVIYEKKPDYILILPWRYASPIIKKHKEYLERGGHFIKILPTVEVISSTSQTERSVQNLAL